MIVGVLLSLIFKKVSYVKKLPLGIQSFKEIASQDYIYIDKTQYIYQLLNDARYYFLSRPRRFGKSLLLDTINAVFEGDKHLFKGLRIYDSDYNFESHPVLKLDLSNISNESPDALKESLLSALKKRVRIEKLDIDERIPSDLFKHLIEDLYIKYGRTVVVLIDEYDKPILDHLGNIKVAEANRQILRSFYGILKSMDSYLRFVFITGVSKFIKTSIFSELNNLADITLTKKYANICGVATDDFNQYFCEHINYLSGLDDFKPIENIHERILSWYDGYSWDGRTKVLNPFSLLNFFMQERFSSFWYSSGTPKFLMDIIKNNPGAYMNLKNLEITELTLDTADINQISIEPLLFQTGYLTIKKVITTDAAPVYLLDLPNFEVREAFNLHVIASLTESGDVRTGQAQIAIKKALQNGDLQKIRDILKSLFASIPYQLHIDREAYYHSIFYAVMNILGFDIDVETSVSKGRIDAVLMLNDKIYIMEFKYADCTPDLVEDKKKAVVDDLLTKAMDQIKKREYAAKYIGSGKIVYLAAFVFSGRDEIEMEVQFIK